MNININIRADSADDYKAAIKALMDGAGMVGFDIPGLPIEPQPRDTKTQQQAEAEELLRKQAAKAQQQATVEAPVPSAGEMPIEAEKPAEKPTAAKAVTIDEVQALGRKMALAGKMDRVAAVLKKYDAPKITALPAEAWAAVKADLEAANNE
nr:MAG TPA: hypothetical protein [Caudoviricetes sp.]